MGAKLAPRNLPKLCFARRKYVYALRLYITNITKLLCQLCLEQVYGNDIGSDITNYLNLPSVRSLRKPKFYASQPNYLNRPLV